MDERKFRNAFLLLLVVGISLLFVAMIRNFLMALLLAAIFSGMARPLYRRLLSVCKQKRPAASALTLLVLVIVVLIPFGAFVGIVTTQALHIAENAYPWIESQLSEPNTLDGWIERLPFAERLAPYNEFIMTKVGQLAESIGSFAVRQLAAAGTKTVTFLFMLFVLLYAMFYFLMDGPRMLDRILHYMPLGPTEEEQLIERFGSVTRATIKGTLVIGAVQGTLAGLGFWVAGINLAVFWGTVMAVLSIIPGVGTALVWIPAVLYLASGGYYVAAIGLGLWCAVVVGTVDNVLRPWLVGRDTKMPDIMILVSTLGGLVLFGAVGIIIGPIIAALFITVWELYGEAFGEVLPATSGAGDAKP
jgi:predicted PurR-regulated permease PerM